MKLPRPTHDGADALRALDDSSLMERAAAGDVAAFAVVYDRHATAVHTLVRRMLGDTDNAEDLLHDVFLEAWRCVKEYTAGRGSVRVWLLVRARSRTLDRRGQRQREQLARAHAHAYAANGSPAREQASERQLAVREALARLTAEVRETLELTYFGGLTAPELSAVMGVPEGTVKSRLARGLAALKSALRLLDDEPDGQ